MDVGSFAGIRHVLYSYFAIQITECTEFNPI